MNTRITSVEVFSLHARLGEPFHWASGTACSRNAVLVSISTEIGIAGWGEAIAVETAVVIREALAPLLRNSDALDREALLPQLRAAAARSCTQAAVAAEAVGAVEVALWDIAARAAGRPLCSMLAQVYRDQVEVYASSIYYSGDQGLDPGDEALDWIGQGFQGVKIKVGRMSLAEDMRRVEAVRRALGREAPLMADANQICNVASAVSLAGALAPLGVVWLEEPLPSHDIAAHRALRGAISVPVATGENLRSAEEFAPFVDERLVDFVQPNVARVGGLSAALQVVQSAAQSGLRVAIHHWGTPIGLAASLHLACCVPHNGLAPTVEVDCSPNPLRDIAATQWRRPTGGKMSPPPGAGLGVVPDMEVIAQYHDALA